MRILYLSGLASQVAISKALQRNPDYSGYAMQKFNRLIVEGLVRNGHQVTALSTFYLPGIGRGYHRKNEIEKGVNYQYISSPNNLPSRHVWMVLYCFFKVLIWGLAGKKDKVFMADVLNISACIGAVAASRLIGLRCVGVMTDMPGLMVHNGNSTQDKKKTGKGAFITRMNKSFLSKFSHYVFLTEQMNVVNIHNRPYIVMEGLVDADMQVPEMKEKSGKRIVLYAGALHERYGLKLLVEGFMKTNLPDTELWIYGAGSFADELPEYNKKDSRILYKGIKPNSEVVEAELKATLLVNPRPTHEEFTKYSFPSKNMEYMVSGTPLLTTMLPGMPLEYYPYVFLFDCDETVDGYSMVLQKVLSLPDETLRQKGIKAREWVLGNKNHISQTARIVDLIKAQK